MPSNHPNQIIAKAPVRRPADLRKAAASWCASLAEVLAAFLGARRSLRASESGNVLMITALALPMLLGIAGLAIEGSNWYTTRRDMQNAADAAVVAAATNGATNYLNEARAMAKQYGFTNGSQDTTVTASNSATCPSGGSTCYRVTITRNIPLVFAQVLGFTGNATAGGSNAIQLSATAVAKQGTSTHEYCLLALGNGVGTAAIDLQANGAPMANLSGCGVASLQSMDCNGHDLGAAYGDAVGSNTGCGAIQNSNVASISNPYASLNSSIPASPCSSYSGQTWSANRTLSGTTSICGTLSVTSDVTLSGTGVVVIYDGDLNVSPGVTLQTASGAGVTFILAGSNSSSISHRLVGGKNTVFDLAPPTSGAWSGITVYEASNLTQNVDMTFNGGGNTPTFSITGVVYLPHSTVTLSGSVSKATNGVACIVFVVQSVTFNGGGYVADRANCPSAGVTLATGALPGRSGLVD